eukprot:GILJ01000182.1.p1 GENE.GILJ01000182.1~~GILJ01000182.1.p1  ORF type:complete len:351 (-),score=38.72 GILJ01000182.1:320-1372(-)
MESFLFVVFVIMSSVLTLEQNSQTGVWSVVVKSTPGRTYRQKFFFIWLFIGAAALFLYTFAINIRKHVLAAQYPSQRQVVETTTDFPVFASVFAAPLLTVSVLQNIRVSATLKNVPCPAAVFPASFRCVQAWFSPFSSVGVTGPTDQGISLQLKMANASASFVYVVADIAGRTSIDLSDVVKNSVNQISVASLSASAGYDVVPKFYQFVNGSRQYTFSSTSLQGRPCQVDWTGTYCNISYSSFVFRYMINGVIEYVDYTLWDLLGSTAGLMSMIVGVVAFFFPALPPPGFPLSRNFRFEKVQPKNLIRFMSFRRRSSTAKMNVQLPSAKAEVYQTGGWNKIDDAQCPNSP